MDRHRRAGLYQYTRNAVAFRSITFNDLPYNLSKPVRALYVDHERSLWVGTKGEGLLRIPNFYDRKTSTQPMSNRKPRPNSDLLDNSVYTFAASSRNLLWIGTDGDGLNYYSYADRRIHRLGVPRRCGSSTRCARRRRTPCGYFGRLRYIPHHARRIADPS